MTSLDFAIMSRMKQIVLLERRPFSYIDFKDFEILNRNYKVAHGTFRNKISKLVKKGIVELEYNSKLSFYSLAGIHFGNTMIRNLTGNTGVIGATQLIDFIQELPLENKSIHDIHMKFSVPDIWTVISSLPKYNKRINPKSKDIKLDPIVTEELKIITTIHHTDTVTVIVGCSFNPVSLEEVSGIIRLSSGLIRTEERISRVVDECGEKLPGGYERIPIPSHERWVVTLWHFGKDSKKEYTGEGFSVTFGYAKEALIRIYTKEKNPGKKTIRLEAQHSPNNSLYKAIQEKINSNDTNI